MKRIIILISAPFIVAGVFILAVYISLKPQTVISNSLGIDASKGNVMTHFDDHGGFHGDGMTYTVLSFSDDKVLEQIKTSTQWEEFPLDDTVMALVHGISDGMNHIGPVLTDKFWNPLVPEIQNGYYRLVDRQTDQSADIMHRYSINIILGIYDTDTNTLYYCKFDT